MAGDVDRDRQRGVLIFPLDKRQAQFAIGNPFEIVPGNAQLVFDRTVLVLKLLTQVVHERLHHFVVEHLPPLRFEPALFELGRPGDGNVALCRVGHECVAGRAGENRSCQKYEQPNGKPFATKTRVDIQNTISWNGSKVCVFISLREMHVRSRLRP
jgi:hypothetical protein